MRHQPSKAREEVGYIEPNKHEFVIAHKTTNQVKPKHIELPAPTLQQHLEALAR